jgi:hypothetical protein
MRLWRHIRRVLWAMGITTVPWTLLRVLTTILRARKGRAASSEGLRLANHATLEWTLKVEKHPEHARLGHGVSGFWAGSRVYLGQGLRGLPSLAFCWRRSEKLPLPFGGSTSAATRSRFAAASGLAGSPSCASFS